ncbi:MAG: N-acetylmuramoyl-L-alanine amidase [Clostridia bacterium]|nr:N-acetylmuramoyl-L-alanine amidase [Clostridia bacterium]
MSEENIVLEMKRIANRRKKKNNRKKRRIKTFNFFLFIIMIFCIYVLWESIKPNVVSYIHYLSSPLVCIDPGHGGNDTGAEINNYERVEKDDDLALALAVNDILKERGIRTCMTRNKDKTISLSDRAKTANNKNAALFVSIHRNYSNNIDAHGLEVWASKNKTDEETLLGNNILDELSKCKNTFSRGLKYGNSSSENQNYYVNGATKMPSVIVEMGFMTYDMDNRLFDTNFMDYALAIANGIEKTLYDLYPDEMIS